MILPPSAVFRKNVSVPAASFSVTTALDTCSAARAHGRRVWACMHVGVGEERTLRKRTLHCPRAQGGGADAPRNGWEGLRSGTSVSYLAGACALRVCVRF